MYELRRRIRMWGGDFDGRDLYCNSTKYYVLIQNVT